MPWLWIGFGFFLVCIFLICGFLIFDLFRVACARGVPSLSSADSIVDTVIARELFPRTGLILDLGCGNGRTLRRFFSAGLKGPLVGYESLFVPWALGRVLNSVTRSNVTIMRADALEAPFEEARGIYLFLLPDVLKQLAPELTRRSSSGTIIVSAEFPLPGWQPQQILEARGITSRRAKIFVYKKMGN